MLCSAHSKQHSSAVNLLGEKVKRFSRVMEHIASVISYNKSPCYAAQRFFSLTVCCTSHNLLKEDPISCFHLTFHSQAPYTVDSCLARSRFQRHYMSAGIKDHRIMLKTCQGPDLLCNLAFKNHMFDQLCSIPVKLAKHVQIHSSCV